MAIFASAPPASATKRSRMSGLSNFSSPPPTARIEPCGRFFRGDFILGKTEYATPRARSRERARVSERPRVLALILLPHHDAAEAFALGADGTNFGEVPQRAGREEPGPDA